MWCSTECWDCEDKNCEHYRSKLDLYTENKKLTNNWNELEEWVNHQLSTMTMHIYMMQTYQAILDKMKEIKERYNEKDIH